MRDAAAFARRPAHRKGDAAMDTVPAIEDQLHTLQPICSAQRVSTGMTCGAPAVAVVGIHAIDVCNQMGLSPDGDVVETQLAGQSAHELGNVVMEVASERRRLDRRTGRVAHAVRDDEDVGRVLAE